MINIPKGTKDVLPQESYKWHYIEGKVREIAKEFNLKEIRTPTFEHTELFLRGVGETTDVVNKEMYTFLDKGERSITLKPEGTAGVVRAYLENGLASLAMPLKMYYITPVFRYEKPQAGRLREHHQFGIEVYGSESAVTDAEVISIASSLFEKLNIKNLTLNINSIGCPTCRAEYNKALKEYYRPHLDEMCETCRERFDKNPLRILDCKEEKCKEINVNAPAITDYLCADCKAHFESLKEYLTAMNIPFVVNSRIVRGLDYYTRTVFEFVSNNIGSQGTVCGGGRYDGLVEQLGGKHTPCAGFGMGIERLLLLMDSVGIDIPENDGISVYFATFGENALKKALLYTSLLRKAGVSADFDHLNKSFKAQFKYANKINAKYVVSIGDDEINSGVLKVKNMQNGEETACDIAEFEESIKKAETASIIFA